MYYNGQRKGDGMKLKRWHMFLVICILFGCSFYIVNTLKFDKFYRVNGINNDNRMLIEKYLDDEEQTYLIENQISIHLFIDYLEEDDFHLQNYQYYNLLKDSGRYKKVSDILDIGNSLATRLTYLFKSNDLNYAKTLIDRNLEKVFLSEETFQFDYIDLYTDMLPLYETDDYSFVKDTQKYVERLETLGIKGTENIKNHFDMLTQGYTQSSLQTLLTAQLPSQVKLVYNPYEYSTLVDNNHYIGTYEPTGLLLIQDIPRVRYAMYLEGEAYDALLKMYEAISKDYSGFLLREAYVSYQSLDEKEIGYNEYQLGLTIDVTQSGIAYKDFKDQEMSQWLEEHAYEYGFVLRYPKEKASITGKTYNAHVYRYVGKALAQSLHESHLTLEEYQSQK